MENLLLRVQGNVAKEFEVEKDVAARQDLASSPVLPADLREGRQT